MGGFSGTVLTVKGRALQAKVQTGVTLQFTKVTLGDGLLASGQSLENLTNLIAPKMDVPIQGVSVIGDGTSRVRCLVSNVDLSTGFFVREVGLFAQDPQDGEILYAIANAGNQADYLPAGGGAVAVEHVLDIITVVGSSANVTAVIDPSVVLATKQDVDEVRIIAEQAQQTASQPPANSVSDDAIGSRVADPSQVPTGNGPGKLAQWLSWLINRIKAITGKDNWWESPTKSLEQLNNDVAAHLADNVPHIPYVIASGSTNAYTVTLNPVPTSYVEGMAVAVKINVENTGASTLNVNGLGAKSIKKANGNDVSAGNLKAGSVYTFRYNGTNFILQGEGGGGTAQPGDVLSGKTFTNDVGEQTGTMPNNGAMIFNPSTVSQTIPAGYHNGSGVINPVTGTATAADVLSGKTFASSNGINVTGTMPNHGAYNITPGTSNIAIPAGYHNGSGVVYGDADLVANNIKSGISIFGVTGALIPAGASMIKSIQRGVASLVNYDLSVTISSVDLTKSFVIVYGAGDNNGAVTGYLSNSTTLYLQCFDQATFNVYWQVIEFNSGVSIQTGEINIAGGLATNVTISSVDISKSFLILSNRDGNYNIESRAAGRLTSSTNIELVSSSSATVRWYVITFV